MSFHYGLLLLSNIALLSYGHPSNILIQRSNPMNAVEPKDYRLIASVKPSYYRIEIEPFFEEAPTDYEPFTFRGTVEIKLKAQEAGVKEIELHMNQLEYKTIVLRDDQGLTHGREVAVYQNETHKLKIPLLEELKMNVVYSLYIEYTGVLNDDLKGFYRSSYSHEGKKVWMAATQFETTNARRAFPVFDEPSLKAVFQLNIVRPVKYATSLTNTALDREEVKEENKTVREIFKPTPLMSPYLLAFVIHNFNEKQTPDKSYGVWARPEAESQLSYSFSVGEKLLKEMGTWMDYPFTKVPEIQKVNMIALPDLNPNAMENWGAITFREYSLLVDDDESSELNKQGVAQMMAHEIAHYWFGNLVTCDWWSEAWLNEGFANYFQSFATDLVINEWDLSLQFVVDQVQTSLEMDSLPDAHPLTNPDVYTPTQVSTMMGSLSYKKGASILRFIEHHLGTDNFKKALQTYLKSNEYKAVKPEALFTAFDAQSPDAKVSELFTAWTTQTGYPVLTVTSRVNETIKLKQKRFLLNEKEHNDKTRWSIPITYANNPEDFGDSTTRVTYPSTQTGDLTIELPADGTLGFYILNVQQVGYYRVNYDKENWDAISAALRTEDYFKIHVLNRAQIVDDLFNFARNGLLSYEFAMPKVEYVKNDQNYIPWMSTFNGLTYLSKRIGLGNDNARFREHVIHLTENLYKHLEFEPKTDEAHTDTLLRTHLLNWACKHGHEDCINKSLEEFQKLRTEPSHIINPNIRIPVYCTAIREGTEEDFDFLWDKYLNSNVAAEKVNILSSLGCVKNQKMIDNFLDKVLSNDVRVQDKSSSFTSSYTNNHENVDFVYTYVTKNHKEWTKVMGSVGMALSDLSEYFTSEDQVKKLEAFGKTIGLASEDVKMISAAVEKVRKTLLWDKERLVEVRNYFNVLDDGNSASSISFNVSVMLLSIVLFCYLS